MRKIKVKIKDKLIGGGSRILIQSMTNTLTKDIEKTVFQVKELEKAGCEIVRVAVLDKEDAKSLKKIKQKIGIPLVADIHFDYRLALLSIENGADKIRINPGNIGGQKEIKQIVEKCSKKQIPIRVGVNSGSIEKDILKKYKMASAEALVESALKNIKLLEDLNFYEIVVSLKHSNVKENIKAYEKIYKKVRYPLHLGVTEAGTFLSSTIKSSIALGVLLNKGIGDTIRVSISGDPIQEMEVAKKILASLDLREEGVEIISCPTCARTSINVTKIAKDLESSLKDFKKNIKVAVMGCLVNGPGESKEADLGICGINKNDNHFILFKRGKVIRKIKKNKALDILIQEVKNFNNNLK